MKPNYELFEEWWAKDGRYIDPDTEDVPWVNKPKELAAAAFMAGLGKDKILYGCIVHGDWDAKRESGCPQCVVAMRRQLERYRDEDIRKPQVES